MSLFELLEKFVVLMNYTTGEQPSMHNLHIRHLCTEIEAAYRAECVEEMENAASPECCKSD